MPGRPAFGATIMFGSPTPTTTVPNVTSIQVGGDDVEQIDVTSHDSAGAYREFVASFIDPGELTIQLNFDPNLAAHRATTGGLLALRDSRAVTRWRITFPGTPSHRVEFDGFVKSFEFEAPTDDKISATCTVKITGAHTWTYGAV